MRVFPLAVSAGLVASALIYWFWPLQAETTVVERSAINPVQTPAENDRGHWLLADDPQPAAEWLAERSKAHSDLPLEDRARRIALGLLSAQVVYHDKQRMIANRIAQIADTAAEYGDRILPEELLVEFTFTPAGTDQLWLGIVAQAYIELRRAGRSHSQAVLSVHQSFSAEEARQ